MPGIINYGDITKINGDNLPNFNLLCGGSPCQNLSLAGKREGLAGRESRLFYEYCRILHEKQPEYFIWENVEAAITSQRGWDFARMQNCFSEAGYSIKWAIYNTSDFGIPMQRDRIFVIGYLGEKCPSETLFIPKDDRLFDKKRNSTLPVFTKTDSKGCSKQRARIITKDEIGIRHFTPLERERLMGWPDEWTRYGLNDKDERIEISNTQRIMMTGNGVNSVVVNFIIDNYINV